MRVRRTAVTVLGVLTALTAVAACESGGGGARSAAGSAVLHHEAATGSTAPVARADGAGLVVAPSEIRTAEMTVTVRPGRLLAARADAAEVIAVRAGGVVDADQRTTGAGASAVLVLRVPPDRLGAVLSDLSRLGVERSRDLSTQDVTAKVADVASRATSARQAIARLRELYRRTTKISDVIAVESELAARESDLEALEAQQRALGRQTAMARVTLTLTPAPPVAAPPPTPTHRGGFVGGLENGWDALAAAAGALAVGLGAALPFLALLVALLALGRVVWLRLRRPRPSAPTPPA